jgi:hypothetical protein
VPVCDLPFELLLLQYQRRMALFQVLSAPFILIQADDLCQIRLGEAFELPVQRGLCLAQIRPPSVEFLREPVATMRPFQGVGYQRRLLHHGT